MNEKSANDGEILLETAVREVVLMEDRAQVVREGKADLPAGRVRVRVEGVAPVLADKTLAVSVLSGPTGTEVAQARVKRILQRRAEHRPEDVAAVEAELEAEEEKAEINGSRRQLLEEELDGLHEVADRRIEDISADAAWGRASPDEWKAELRRVAEREARLRSERVSLDKEARDLSETIHDLQRRRDALYSPAADFTATIEAELHLESGGPVILRFLYLVPGACWRPRHRATLASGEGGTTVRFEMDGCVWQYTGEDWEEATLVFSTQRPSLGTEPPLLSADHLYTEEKEEVVDVEVRDQVLQTTGLGRGARREAAELPGIDDAGEALALRSRHTATIPSDGRPYRVAIFAFETEATSEFVALPELALAVIHKVTLTNEAKQPVLAGPVDLVAGSGFVGRTSVLYMAPGERFELGFGPDPELRVHRRVEAVEHEKGMLSRWIKSDHTVLLQFSNIGAGPKTFRVKERIPVSEVEQVRIAFDRERSSGDAAPDGDGFVTWTVDLPPGGTAKRKLRYAVEKQKDVVGI